ncbi:TRAF3-interacting JNK-activating modulator isoform X2 [Syngnathoides biaculeatus]|uniref:TRAF3-interacting JNK-activating modulator isoform X2 n=1 Tax=Syngnathoides biaculeatus TaxID=300417 RepID=UPI002ADDAB2C|nr:TRAF3-interacting JNK-activating modulator isoform X2 [Syngnathoides biaculeatus]
MPREWAGVLSTRLMEALCPRGLQAPPARDFDRKVEIRAEKHEQLRRRTNATSCRIPAREWDTALLMQTLKNRRQVEFLRRRSLPQPPRPPPPPAAHDARTSFRFPGVSVRSVSRTSERPGPRGDPVLMKMMVQDEGCAEVTQAPNSKVDPVNNADATHKRMTEAAVQTESGLVTIEESDILQLQDYMQEGLWREEAIMKKVAALQELFLQLQNALNTTWKARCSEDALRNKVKVLETQLQAGLQRFPKETSRKLVLQMKKQRATFEEKTPMDVQDKNEDLGKTVALKEALLTAKEDVQRLQTLYEELMLTSQKLRQELDASGERARQQESQIELSRIREATVTEELASLRREKNELQFHLSLQEEYYQFAKDRTQYLNDDSTERRDVSVQSTPEEEEEASPKGGDDVEEELLHTQEVLRSEEKEVTGTGTRSLLRAEIEDTSAARWQRTQLPQADGSFPTPQTEPQAAERAVEADRTPPAQRREDLGGVARKRGKSTWRVSPWSLCRLLLLFLLLLLSLLLSMAAVGVWQPWHPDDFCFDIRTKMENCFMQMIDPQKSGCFRPI